MPRPTFFIIGAPKCATTALHDAVVRHPEVCMSREKEPRFFELHYQGEVGSYERDAFPPCAEARAVGEASPMYLLLPYVPERLHRHYPDARLIVLLREPLARAHSAWWMHFSAGREALPFGEAMAENLQRLHTGLSLDGASGEYLWRRNVEAIEERGFMLLRTYVESGLYGAALVRWLEHFPREQILVLLFDELRRDPGAALGRVFEHIGVDAVASVDFPHSNPAMAHRWAGIVRALSPLVRKGWVPRPLVDAGKAVLGGRRADPPNLSDQVAGELKELYREDLALMSAHFPGVAVPEQWEEALR